MIPRILWFLREKKSKFWNVCSFVFIYLFIYLFFRFVPSHLKKLYLQIFERKCPENLCSFPEKDALQDETCRDAIHRPRNLSCGRKLRKTSPNQIYVAIKKISNRVKWLHQYIIFNSSLVATFQNNKKIERLFTNSVSFETFNYFEY